jgi:alpha/beta superfamily hydrolase
MFVPGLVRIDLVDFGFRQLQFAAGDAESEDQALLGGFSFGALAANILDMHDPEDHGGGDCG